MNKELSPATKKSVEDVFVSLKDKEDKLSLWVDYLHKYSELIRIENDTEHNKLVGEAELKEAYEKYEKIAETIFFLIAINNKNVQKSNL